MSWFNGINFGGKVDGITGKNSTGHIQQESVKLGGFGYGFSSGGVGLNVERHVVPDALLTKFGDVESPKYHKNIAQLSISDADYIPDNYAVENDFCEV